MNRSDVIVIGAGIVGLAHARAAASQGRSVLVLERSGLARGASVRNFGMVWPIGQPAGPLLDRALRSRAVWLELAENAGFWIEPAGSLHAARHEDELRVIREFAESAASTGYSVDVLPPDHAVRRSPALRRDGLLGALWSAAEACIDPRQAVAAISRHLASSMGVRFLFGTTAVRCAPGLVESADGQRFETDHVLVCTGEDQRTLYPDLLARAPIQLCKLQMMRTAPQPGGFRIGPMLAAGLTLQHYPAFASCPGLPQLRARLASDSARLLRWGIHVLVSQNELGELLLGDSHEYGPDPDPVLRAEVEDLIMSYLRDFMTAPDLRIAERWMGVYPKRTDGRATFFASPEPGVTVINAVGGAGMTLSFGLAEETWPAIAAGRPLTHATA